MLHCSRLNEELDMTYFLTQFYCPFILVCPILSIKANTYVHICMYINMYMTMYWCYGITLF